MSKGDLIQLAKLNNLDMLSILTSAVCHDFGHDGLNNAYHVNALSERAVRYNDQAVQENFHVAESFQILKMKGFDFLHNFNNDEVKMFRKRMVGMILATDMARHVTDLGSFKSLLETREIKQGKNAEKLIDFSSAAKEFDSKQQLIEICLHAADVSSQCRPFEIAKEWSYLLFEEFFW